MLFLGKKNIFWGILLFNVLDVSDRTYASTIIPIQAHLKCLLETEYIATYENISDAHSIPNFNSHPLAPPLIHT